MMTQGVGNEECAKAAEWGEGGGGEKERERQNDDQGRSQCGVSKTGFARQVQIPVKFSLL